MTKELLQRLFGVLDGQITFWGHKQLAKELSPQESYYLEQVQDHRLMLIVEREFEKDRVRATVR